MAIRYKLDGAPLRYTFSQVPGGSAAFEGLHGALWSEHGAVDARIKELLFLRTSLVNHCAT